MHLAVSVCTTLLDFFMSFAFCFAMNKRLKMPATFLEVQIYCWPVNLIKLITQLQVIIFFRYFCHFYCLLVLALLKSRQKCSYQHCAVCNLPISFQEKTLKHLKTRGRTQSLLSAPKSLKSLSIKDTFKPIRPLLKTIIIHPVIFKPLIISGWSLLHFALPLFNFFVLSQSVHLSRGMHMCHRYVTLISIIFVPHRRYHKYIHIPS